MVPQNPRALLFYLTNQLALLLIQLLKIVHLASQIRVFLDRDSQILSHFQVHHFSYGIFVFLRGILETRPLT